MTAEMRNKMDPDNEEPGEENDIKITEVHNQEEHKESASNINEENKEIQDDNEQLINRINEIEEEPKEAFEDYNIIKRSERTTKPVERLTCSQMVRKAMRSNLYNKNKKRWNQGHIQIQKGNNVQPI